MSRGEGIFGCEVEDGEPDESAGWREVAAWCHVEEGL